MRGRRGDISHIHFGPHVIAELLRGRHINQADGYPGRDAAGTAQRGQQNRVFGAIAFTGLGHFGGSGKNLGIILFLCNCARIAPV